MNQTKELREMSYEELEGKLKEAKEELFNLRFQAATGQLDNTAKIGDTKKNIARVCTLMREFELSESKA